MKRFAPLFALPGVLLLAWLVAPLASGRQTLILRDVLQTHLLDRIALGESLRRFELPLVDTLRAGGQALAGNLNALPFYPDNLLLLLGTGGQATLWALNAHFWLHWFVALGAAFWMARAFGLPPPAAWMTATVYAFSGYFTSQLNLYNTVAAAALAPALVAAVLETAPGKSPATGRRGLAAAAVVWALLLLGGEPLLALLALALAGGALALVAGRRAFSAGGLRLGLGLAAGTLLAAPQIVEMARILPHSFRSNAAFGEAPAIVGSFRPAHLADLFFPFFFGRPSLTEVLAPQQFDGYPPLLFTLYPGLLALALAVAGAARALPSAKFSHAAHAAHAADTAPAGSVAAATIPDGRRRAALWGAGAIAVALFFALGRFNPLVEGLWSLPWGRLLRFPAKFWLLGAVGGSLLCGLGFESAMADGRRRVERLLALFAALFALLLAVSIGAPRAVAGGLAALLQPNLPAPILAGALVRLQGLALLSIALLVVALLLLRLGRRAPLFAAGGLVWLHAATQAWAMLPAVPMDEVGPYLEPPPLLAAIPAGSVVVHGANLDLFRPGTMSQGTYPDGRILWLTRRSARELYPFAALLHGLRAELAISPEGLDSFLTQAITVGIKGFPDRRRIDLLEALGVDYLLLDRELGPEARDQVREIAADRNFGQTVRLYELADRAREVEFATRVVPAPQMNAALEAIFDPAFDPHRTAVVPGSGGVREMVSGSADTGVAVGAAQSPSARLVANRSEEVVVEVEAPAAGVLFVRRAWLPLWRVAIDGAPAPTLIAQVARLGVALPAGRHRVRFWIDRRPLAAGFGLAALGLVLLVLVLRSVRAPRTAAQSAGGHERE